MAVVDIADKNHWNGFIAHEGVVLLKYYMIDCAPCRLLAPTIRKISEENPNLQVGEVLLNRFAKADFPDISKAPTVEIYRDGCRKKTLTGKELTYANIMGGIYEAERG